MQRRRGHHLPHLLLLTLFVTLSSSSPTSPKHKPPIEAKPLPSRYHVFFNLLWASFTAALLVANYKVSKHPSLDQKTRHAYRLLCIAIATRLASHLLTAAFAEFVLPDWNPTGGGRSILGTFADASSWVVDALIFTAVFRSVHEHDDQPLKFQSLMKPSHETFDRILIRLFWASICLLSTISFIHPEPLASGYNPLLFAYSVYLAILLVLLISCLWWRVIVSDRVKKKIVLATSPARWAPGIGMFVFAVWSIRCFLKPVPFFVIDVAGQILVHPWMYSFGFCFAIIACREKPFIIYFSVLAVAGITIFGVVVHMISNLT